MDSFRLSQGLSLCSADRCRTTSRDLSTASHSFSLVSFDRHSVLIKVPFFFIAKFPLWEFCFIKAISHSFHIHIFCCSCGPFSYKSLFDSHSGNRTTFSICQSVALPSKFIALPSDSISSNQLCSKSWIPTVGIRDLELIGHRLSVKNLSDHYFCSNIFIQIWYLLPVSELHNSHRGNCEVGSVLKFSCFTIFLIALFSMLQMLNSLESQKSNFL